VEFTAYEGEITKEGALTASMMHIAGLRLISITINLLVKLGHA